MLLLLLIILFLLAILIKTIVQRGSRQNEYIPSPTIPASGASTILSQSIQCKTVSQSNSEETDYAEFERLHQVLKDAFPLCEHHRLTSEGIGKYNRVYRFEGNSDQQPALLTAHLDVVSAQADQWTHPPFSGTIDDKYVWGRGSFDCKLQVTAILQAFESLLKEGGKLNRTWYVAFGCDEECNGSDKGASVIAAYFASQGLHFSLVLDEGGVVSEHYIKGFSQSIAVVGIAEKGYLDLGLSVQKQAGHSSTPRFPTALGTLCKAISTLEHHQMKAKLTQPVQSMLTTLGKQGPFSYSLLFLNLGVTKKLLFSIFSKNPTLNAVIRTTVAPTVIQASDKSNVIAQEATAQVNVRLLPGDTPAMVIAWMQRMLKDPSIHITVLRHTPPSKVSELDSAVFTHLQSIIRETFPEALTTPYLMLGATDARKYQELSDCIYRFTPARMDQAEVSRMHAPDERISIENVETAVVFYKNLLSSW